MDLPRTDADMHTYNADYYCWTQQQPHFCGRMDRVDLEDLAEEVESSGNLPIAAAGCACRCA